MQAPPGDLRFAGFDGVIGMGRHSPAKNAVYRVTLPSGGLDRSKWACRLDHWRRGHKQICKKIHRGGNAEQYYADKKYKEAVAEAVEACADDTKGQTCYICTQPLHWKTKEGLVRGCCLLYTSPSPRDA